MSELISPLSSEALDIEGIKSKIKQYLIDNNVITDINYEGSNISVLVQILAYMVYNVNASHALNANQTMLLLSDIRQNIVYLAQQLGYNITRPISSKMSVKLTIDGLQGYDTLLIPKFTKFNCNGYTFYLQEDITFTSSIFEVNTTLIEGTLVDYLIDSSLRFKPTSSISNFLLGYTNIENDNVYIRIKKANDVEFSDYYTKVNSLLSIDTNTFYEELEPELNYLKIYTTFQGKGYTITPNDEVDVSFLLSNGSNANGIIDCQFLDTDTFLSTINAESLKVTITVISPSSGGSNIESNESIKASAPLFYNSGNRTVNKYDYNSFLEKSSLIDKAISWGGEIEIPKLLGHILVSGIPQTNNDYFTTLEKAYIINYLSDPRIMATILKVYQPSYIEIDFDIKLLGDIILIDDKKILIENAVTNYFSTELTKFECYYFENKVIKTISDLFETNNKAGIKVITKPKLLLNSDLFDNFSVDGFTKIYIPNSSERYYLTKNGERIDLPNNYQDLYTYYSNGWVKTYQPDYDLDITFSGTINGKTLSMGALNTITIDTITYDKKDILLNGVIVGYFNITLDELIFTTDISSDLSTSQYININYSDEINVKSIKNTVIRLGSIQYV